MTSEQVAVFGHLCSWEHPSLGCTGYFLKILPVLPMANSGKRRGTGMA